jgi:DNA-binding transcriptional ArsR family regulator
MSLEVDSRKQLRALSHPVRLRILSLLTGAAMSSAELARELGMKHAAVSFHVRQLAAAGYLQLAETRSVRGGRERRYRHEIAGSAQWTSEDARLTVRAVSEELLRRLADTPTDAWRIFGDAELWVPPHVWDDVVCRMAAAVKDLHHAALAPRTPRSLHVSATAMLFAVGQQSPDATDPDATDPQTPGRPGERQ